MSRDPSCSFKVNQDKTELVWIHAEPPPLELTELAERKGIPLRLGYTKILGTVIGSNISPEEAEEGALNRVMQKVSRACKTLMHPEITMQAAGQILKLSVAHFSNHVEGTIP